MKDELKSAKIFQSTLNQLKELKGSEFGAGMSQPRIIKEAVNQLYKKLKK
ncbi:hypothetical protein N9924_01050 [bacterium]|nr:hypothetical protein [bacterium]